MLIGQIHRLFSLTWYFIGERTRYTGPIAESEMVLSRVLLCLSLLVRVVVVTSFTYLSVTNRSVPGEARDQVKQLTATDSKRTALAEYPSRFYPLPPAAARLLSRSAERTTEIAGKAKYKLQPDTHQTPIARAQGRLERGCWAIQVANKVWAE